MRHSSRRIFLVVLTLLSCLGVAQSSSAKSFNGFLSPIWVRAREAPYSPIGVSAHLEIEDRAVSGQIQFRLLPTLLIEGTLDGHQAELRLVDPEGRVTGRAEGLLKEDHFELSTQLQRDGRTEIAGQLSLTPALEWRASPRVPSNRNQRDAQRRVWWRPGFDDSDWEAMTLPQVDSIEDTTGLAKLYRTSFTVNDPAMGLALTFSSDGGMWIYVNGRYLGQWGGDSREGGCINHPEERCGDHGQIPKVDIPIDWLREGENTLAVKVIHVRCCESYFNLMLRRLDKEHRRP